MEYLSSRNIPCNLTGLIHIEHEPREVIARLTDGKEPIVIIERRQIIVLQGFSKKEFDDVIKR
jgi:hypothetical protein